MPRVICQACRACFRTTKRRSSAITVKGGANQMRWGMPPPPKLGGAPITNIRNTSSPHWRGWLKPEHRCLVPASSFSEYAPEPNPVTKKKDVVWFALSEDRPLFAFAGLWTPFKGERGPKSKPIPRPHLVYGFLTTAPNAVVQSIRRRCRSCSRRPKNLMSGCARHGMKPRRCNAHSRMTIFALSCVARTKKIRELRNVATTQAAQATSRSARV